MIVHLYHSFAGSQRVFRHRHERVGAEVNMLTELWYNLKGPEQRYLDSIEGVLVDGERREAGRGTSSGKSSDRMDAGTTGDDTCTKGVGVELDSIEGVLVEGE